MVKNHTLVKIEGAVEAEAARLLREVDGIEVAIRERERRHSHAEAEGRTVRKYERSPTTEADDPSPAST